MEETPALRRHCDVELRKKSPNISRVIKTRNSPRSTYVRDFQLLSQPKTVNVHHNVYKRLNLVTAFKGLTIVTFTDEKKQAQLSTLTKDNQRLFYYPSPSPSPTTTEENTEILELKDNVNIPIPEEVTDDNIPIKDSDWLPPKVAYQHYTCKRRYSSQFLDDSDDECCRCGQLKCKSWPGCNDQGEQ